MRRRHFTNRKHLFAIEQFEQVVSFGNDATTQKKWNAFISKINTKTDDYRTILKTIQNFLEKPFTAAMENKTFTGHWPAANSKWI